MFQHDVREIAKAQRKSELYVELIIRFTWQGILKGAIYGAGTGVWYMIIGALYGAPIGAVAGAILGLVEGIIVGYFVVYKDMAFETTGSSLAIGITISTILVGAVILLVPKATYNNTIIGILIVIILSTLAGFATWQGSCNVAEWYDREIKNTVLSAGDK